LFFPQVVHEYEEPWLNDTDRVKLLIRPTDISGNPTSSHPLAKQEELGSGNDYLAFRSIFVHSRRVFLTCRKILRHGTDGFTSPPKEGMLRIFTALGWG
jgi:hypothetical protein